MEDRRMGRRRSMIVGRGERKALEIGVASDAGGAVILIFLRIGAAVFDRGALGCWRSGGGRFPCGLRAFTSLFGRRPADAPVFGLPDWSTLFVS
jgi:hypothetical protein